MILGAKSRWLHLRKHELINLTNHFELHLEPSDLIKDFEEQVRFLKQFNKVFHIHAPIWKQGRQEHYDFSTDYELFEQVVKLGDLVNKGSYHLVVHCYKKDFSRIKEHTLRLFDKSSKVVLCFENLSTQGLSLDEFKHLFNLINHERAGICLDVCHCYLNKPQTFDAFMNELSHEIIHCHLADVGPNMEHGVQVGEGIINWGHVINRLRELINPVLIPEVTGSHLSNSQGLKIAFNRIKQYLKPN